MKYVSKVSYETITSLTNDNKGFNQMDVIRPTSYSNALSWLN